MQYERIIKLITLDNEEIEIYECSEDDTELIVNLTTHKIEKHDEWEGEGYIYINKAFLFTYISSSLFDLRENEDITEYARKEIDRYFRRFWEVI